MGCSGSSAGTCCWRSKSNERCPDDDLLPARARTESRWHVVDSDEVWHFYSGAPLELLTYEPGARTLRRQVLAPPTMGHEPVGIVAAGVWQAARSLGEYTLVGCNVGPGFEFADFRFVDALEGHQAHFVASLGPYADLL